MSFEIAVAIAGFCVAGTAAALALFMGSRDRDAHPEESEGRLRPE